MKRADADAGNPDWLHRADESKKERDREIAPRRADRTKGLCQRERKGLGIGQAIGSKVVATTGTTEDGDD